MVLAAVLVVCCCPVLCCVGMAASAAAGLSLKSAEAETADGTTSGDSAEVKASPKDAKDEEEMVGMTV